MRRLLPTALVLAAVLPADLFAQQQKDLYDEGTLRTFDLTFSQSTWYADLVAARLNNSWVRGNLVVDGQLFQQVGVRFSGNNSFLGTSSLKKSLAIKMDAFIANQQLQKYDNLNLHNGFNDPTMMREVIGYHVLRKYMPAPKCNHVRVNINKVYWGLYVNVQQVDKEMIDDWFKGNDGNRYLAEAPAPAGRGKSALQDLGALLQSYKDAYDLKNDLASAVKPWEDVRTLCQVLNQSTNLPVDLPKVLDVDRALWYLAYYSVVANLNGYNTNGSDYYLYHDEEHGLMNFVAWDMEGAFGASANQTVVQATNQPPFLDETKTSRPLLGKVWGVPEWRARYIHHMRTVLDEEFSWTRIGPLVTAVGNLIGTALQADNQKLYSLQDALDNATKAVTINSGTYLKTVPGLKQLCDDRNAYLRGLAEFKAVAPAVSNLKVTPVDPRPNTQVTITAQVTGTVAIGAVTLYYRVFGGFQATPMFDDGNHGDGAANDGVYGGFVPAAVQTPGANVYYYVGAQSQAAAGGAVGYFPLHGQKDALKYFTQWAIGSSPVSINEVMPSNTNTVKDPAGEFDDWVELYNSSANAVTIGGMYLSDDPNSGTKWQFPANTSIPAKGTLIVWCDNDITQQGLHATFKLSAQGEEISLFDRDGKTRLSHVKFGALETDVSHGSLEDGKPGVQVAYRKYSSFGRGPSPDAVNEPAAGTREYWPIDYTTQRMFLEWVGATRIGGIGAVRSLGGPNSASVMLMLAPAPAQLPIGGGLQLMLGGPLVGPYSVPTNSTGQGVIVINLPNDANLIGFKVYMQVGGIDPVGFTLSNGCQLTLSR